MSIFSRLFKIGQAHTNKALDNMEKPDVMLEQAIRDREAQIADVREKIQKVIASERRQKALLLKQQEEKASWEQKAERALVAGNEDLATKALVRAEEHDTNAVSLDTQWQGMRKDVDSLKVALKKMEDDLAELRRNKEILVAQASAAEVKKDIYEAKAKIGSKNETSNLIARMKAKAETASYEADAAEELANEGGDSLEKEFEKLTAGTSASGAVNDKLAAMKARLNKE